MADKLQWYKFHASDWLSDGKVRLMTSRQRGWYIDLLCWAWQESGFNPQHAEVICQVGRDRAQLDFAETSYQYLNALITAELDHVISLFTTNMQGGKVSHPKLESERISAVSASVKKSEAAKTTNAKRWGKPSDSDNHTESLSDRYARSDSYSISSTTTQKKEAPAFEDLPFDTLSPVEQTAMAEDPIEAWFDEFWKLYWRKSDKANAFKAFKKHATTETKKRQICRAVEIQSPSYLSRESQFRPLAATWLNGRRFEEEPEINEIPRIAPRSGPEAQYPTAAEYTERLKREDPNRPARRHS